MVYAHWIMCLLKTFIMLCLFLAWAQAVAALMIIGLIILIIAFIISCVALCCTLNISLLPFIGALLLLAGKNNFKLWDMVCVYMNVCDECRIREDLSTVLTTVLVLYNKRLILGLYNNNLARNITWKSQTIHFVTVQMKVHCTSEKWWRQSAQVWTVASPRLFPSYLQKMCASGHHP